MEVKFFKLTNGQEIITELVSLSGTGYMIRRPLLVQIVRNAEGNPVLGFMEWSMVGDMETPFALYDTAIAAGPIDPLSEVARSYIEQMTGLIVPPQTGGQILHG